MAVAVEVRGKRCKQTLAEMGPDTLLKTTWRLAGISNHLSPRDKSAMGRLY
jgi:hypothetical protein